MADRARIKIVSDGTPGGTSVWADGKQLSTTHVAFSIGMDDLAKATVTLYVDEAHIEAVCPVELKSEPPAA